MNPTQRRILAALQYYGPLKTADIQEKLRLSDIPLTLPGLVMETSEMIARGEIRRTIQADGSTLYVAITPIGSIAS